MARLNVIYHLGKIQQGTNMGAFGPAQASLAKSVICNFIVIGLLSLLLIVGFQNCSGFEPTALLVESASMSLDSETIDYFTVKASIDRSCVECHGGSMTMGSLDFSSYETLYQSGTIVSGNAKASLFMTSILNGSMPPEGSHALEAYEINNIREWINAGAPKTSRLNSQICEPEALQNSKLVKTSTAEYVQILKDLIGDRVEETWFKDWNFVAPVNGFDTATEARWNSVDLYQRLQTAEKVATVALKSSLVMSHCPQTLDFSERDWNSCAKPIVEHFASRAFRRPLSQAELAAYENLFNTQAASAEHRIISATAPLHGYLDGVQSNLKVNGWVVDPAWPERSVEVHFYLQPANGSTDLIPAGATIANVSRPDVNSALQVNGNHGFEYFLPPRFADGQRYYLHVLAIGTSANRHITNTPLAFTAETAGKSFAPVGQYRASFTEGLKVVMQSILLSPNLMTKPEMLPGGFGPGLEDFTTAARLAFYTRSSFPDDQLWRAAELRLLGDESRLRAETERMLETYGDRFSRNFAGQWLGFRSHLNSSKSLRRSMAMESQLVFESVLGEESNAYDLLTPGYTFVDSQLVEHYGLSSLRPEGFIKMSTNRRGGILNQGNFLMSTSTELDSHTIRRGGWVLDKILCRSLPEIDAATFEEISTAKKSIDPTLSKSEIMKLHRSYGRRCDTCHSQIDPIGLALENYDQFGLWRDTYTDGKPVVSDVEFNGQSLAGPLEFSSQVASEDEFGNCVSYKLLNYARSYTPPYSSTCMVEDIRRVGRQGSLKDAAVEAFVSSIFERRK